MSKNTKVIIVGGGPAGLFSAYLLLKKGLQVDLYDQSSGLAKKFLVAGNGGLNLTHSEDLDQFALRYVKEATRFKKLLHDFSPSDLRDWCHELGVDTFIGSSGRVFPTKFKSAEILMKWVDKLKSCDGLNVYLKHRLIDINENKELTFMSPDGELKACGDKIILALGGASWKKTGSDGLWSEIFNKLDIQVNQFLPMNCGFEREWSDYFKNNVERTCLKHVEISFQDKFIKGDLMLTPYGVEGGVIYGLSNYIRDQITKEGSCTIKVDLRPGLSEESLYKKIKNKPKKMTMSNHLRKSLNFDKFTFVLLKELLHLSCFDDMKTLAQKIKKLEIELYKARPIDEAISTSGGVCFNELSEFLELKKLKDVYVAGEMLDFEAPTGGYLIQASFSTAWAIAENICKDPC